MVPDFPTTAPIPDFSVTSQDPLSIQGATMIVLPVIDRGDGNQVLPDRDLSVQTGIDVHRVLHQAEDDAAQAGVITRIPVWSPPAGCPDLRTVVLIGIEAGEPENVRRSAAVLARQARGHEEVVILAPQLVAEQLRAAVEGIVLGAFELSSRQDPPPPPAGRYWFATESDSNVDPDTLARAMAVARAAWQARRLATMPSNIKSPAWLADEIEGLLEGSGSEVIRFDRDQLQKDGFGGVIAVGQGSQTPPTLLKVQYTPKSIPKRLQKEHVVLVGKGITFDTGGLSIKPADSMVNMKRDMTGAAVVASVMTVLSELDCPVRVTALLPLAENSVDGAAARPGDVISHYGGRTTEITNTDAEGRLILADALAYAVEELNPTTLIDVATLTGGAKVALGTRIGALFASTDELAAGLLEAGHGAGEPWWRLPLSAEYTSKLSSPIADAVNSSGGPPAITAALFLKAFVGEVDWAHLDIASVGDAEEDRFEWTKGPTGFGVRTLLRWLEQFVQPAATEERRRTQ